jgi:4-hydroxybenzoate polyprenyltransferase
MLVPLVQAMRPHQWVKNLLVLAPLVFAHRIHVAADVVSAVLAFVVFCMVSSAVYLWNDVLDREADAQHPTKRTRPIASGALSPGAAIAACLALAVGGCALAVVVSARSQHPVLLAFWVWPVLYAALNVAYSLHLKHRVILDCLCIAFGFVIRVHAGAVAIAVPTSSWILLCTFFFALFLAFCKRREEVARSGGSSATRRTIKDYDLPFLDQMIAPLAALSILSYALYTVSEATIREHGNRNLLVTVPFVTFGVFRYLFLVHRRGEGGDPARLLFRDRQLVLSGLLYGATVGVAFSVGALL